MGNRSGKNTTALRRLYITLQEYNQSVLFSFSAAIALNKIFFDQLSSVWCDSHVCDTVVSRPLALIQKAIKEHSMN